MTTETVELKRTYYRFEDDDGEIVIADDAAVYEPPKVPEPPRKNFLLRQLDRVLSGDNTKFNALFAIILPAICFAVDPIVFKNNGILSEYRGFAWSLATMTIVASAVGLAFGPRFGAFNAALGGLFLTSGVVSLVIGVFLFPFSLVGSLLLIGLLGFTPLFSSLAMFGMSRRMMQASSPHLEQPAALNVFMFTAFVSFLLPYMFNDEFKSIIRIISRAI